MKEEISNNTETKTMPHDALSDGVTYTYSYCTEVMIKNAEKETSVKYPDVMEGLDYKTFETKAKNLVEANKKFLKFQLTLGKIFEIDEEIETDINCENDEDRYICHGLKQDWDTYYFDPNDI